MMPTDIPADRPLAVPSAKAIAKPTYITWLTLVLMTTTSVRAYAARRRWPSMGVATEDGGRRLNTNHEMTVS